MSSVFDLWTRYSSRHPEDLPPGVIEEMKAMSAGEAKSDACSGGGYHDCVSPGCDCECHIPVRLLEEALHLCQHGERAPGGDETWRNWQRKTELYLRARLIGLTLPKWARDEIYR